MMGYSKIKEKTLKITLKVLQEDLGYFVPNFKMPVSDAQAHKQFGNSAVVQAKHATTKIVSEKIRQKKILPKI